MLDLETQFIHECTERDILYDDLLHREQVTVTAPIWITLKQRSKWQAAESQSRRGVKK